MVAFMPSFGSTKRADLLAYINTISSLVINTDNVLS